MDYLKKSPRVVAKEQISSFVFPSDDVLSDEHAIKLREGQLGLALALGNIEHQKVRIYFHDNEAYKLVETTIWALTNDRIVLKGGAGIPIHRIFEVTII